MSRKDPQAINLFCEHCIVAHKQNIVVCLALELVTFFRTQNLLFADNWRHQFKIDSQIKNKNHQFGQQPKKPPKYTLSH